MTKGLTDRQREVLEYIRHAMREDGRPPTVREISDHFGFRSPKAASDHLTALERKGYISRQSGTARNIRLHQRLSPQGLPLVRNVPREGDVLAVENIEESLGYGELFGDEGQNFLVQVEGDSMEGAGIEDQDFVVVAEGARVENGSLAALATDDEPVVRRLYFENGSVKVVAEGREKSEQTLDRDSDELRILGPVVGIVRRV
jgi:repressor LexA